MKLNPTIEAIHELMQLDEKFIGTTNYLGIRYFWHYDYRHYLRDATYIQRQKVHNAFLKAGLKLNESSNAHLSIINKIIK